ncbi:hypothetical protein BC834DRAFT_140642 [Gloeopeniophorella convolvens]|nr:hypothetical protein BC834DRAFT_140642 [Gloeopeniophorella convolvens]
MASARKKDKHSLNLFQKILAFRERKADKEDDDAPRKPTIRASFTLLGSLPYLNDKSVIVQQMLPPNPKLSEILWNFARYKDHRRIRLQQNAHFYSRHPTDTPCYNEYFRQHPMIDFGPLRPGEMIYVLPDKPGRVFLEVSSRGHMFGNVLTLGKVMIFKDFCGNLHGEGTVEKYMEGHAPGALWERTEVGFVNTTGAKWASVAGRNWKQLVHRALRKDDLSVRICV